MEVNDILNAVLEPQITGAGSVAKWFSLEEFYHRYSPQQKNNPRHHMEV